MLVAILAGGESRRMGGGKPLRRLAGATLIARAAALAQGWSDDVRVAVRTPDQVGDTGLPLLHDDPALPGPIAGLAAALRAAAGAGHAQVLTIPCDLPFLPAELAERLRAEAKGDAVVVAASGGRLHPVCALWPVAMERLIAGYAAAGRRSLRGLAETAGYVAVAFDDAAFFNVNTPDDLAEAERRL